MSEKLAIVGMACRLPGARNPGEFWQLLEAGRSAIREIPPERWPAEEFYSPQRGAPGKSVCKWGGFVDDVDAFDHGFFGISAREARNMDPQQRLLLEETWRCLEDAGLNPARLRGSRTAVFAGLMAIDYHQNVTAPGVAPDAYAPLGNYAALLANRLSHVFGWTGESATVDAACASSLAALHEARRALLEDSCDYAVVAAASAILNPWKYIAFSQAGMLSPDGRCHTFDAAANGYVPGEGAVVLLLQREADARRDGNRLHGFLLGSAVNHVGGGGTITAPGLEAQVDVIRRAVAAAGVPFDSIGYLEAHGTGTPLGDPIEVEALTRAFRTDTARTGFCRIGSVKTNIGHLEAAAGLAGIVKVLLMMRHRRIAPTANLDTVNPLIDFAVSPFAPALVASPWSETPRRAGVSSFGFGGANAHCVIEMPPETVTAPVRAQERGRPLPFLLSAASPKSLDELLAHWRSFAAAPGFADDLVPDVCLTLAFGRQSLGHRYGGVVAGADEVRALLAQPMPEPSASGTARPAMFLGATSPLSADAFDALAGALPAIGRRRAAALEALGPASKESAAAFPQAYALGGALLDFGLRPAVIGGEGGGRWAALALAAILPLPAAAARAGGGSTEPVATLARPQIPFFDSVGRRVLMPVSADADYLALLRAGLQEIAEVPAGLLGGVQSLRDNRTFAADLAAWQTALGARGRLADWLDTPPSDPDHRGILTLFLLAARMRLRRRWGLADAATALPSAYGETAELLCDGLLEPAEAIALTEPGGAGLDDIAGRLAGRIEAHGPARLPQLLREHAAGLPEVGDPNAWLASAPGAPFPDDRPVVELDAMPRAGALGLGASGDATRGFVDLLVALWRGGADIDFAPLARPYTKLDLPGMPFEPHRHWIGRPAQKPAAADPAAPDTIVWKAEGAIGDHRIGGRVLVPAAAMLWQAARRAPLGSDIADIAFLRPAAIDGALEIRFEQDAAGFALHSGNEVICRGRFGKTAAATAPPFAETGEPVDIEAFYRHAASRGYDYGAALQVIREAWRTQNGIVAALDIGEAAAGDRETALLDGALQAVLLATDMENGELLLPWHIERARIAAALPHAAQAVVTLHAAHASEISASVTLVGPDSRVAASLEGCRFRAAPAAAVSPISVPLYRPVWRLCPEAMMPQVPCGAILLADRSGLAARLAERLPEVRLLETRDAAAIGAALSTLTAPADLFLIWGADDPGDVSADAFERFAEGVLKPGLELCREMAARRLSCRLRIVTVGVEQTAGDRAVRPFGAALAGLAKSAAREIPGLAAAAIDLPAAPSEADLDLLARVFLPGADLAVRNGGCLGLRLQPVAEPSGAPATHLQPGGTYLIVGGLGGIGRAIALRLMRATGGHVFLAGRRPADAETDAALAALRDAAGAGSATYLQGDVAEAEDVARILGAAQAPTGRIDGIVNSAMVLADGALATLDWPRFAAALRPKVLGDMRLAEALGEMPPDFFVSFASVLGRAGNAGQANYAAACAVQSALARRHMIDGLPARAIEWGYWGDSGRVATADYRERLARIGLLPMADEAGWAAFCAALGAPAATVVAARFGPGWTGPMPEAAASEDAAWTAACETARTQAATEPAADMARMNRLIDGYAAAALLHRLQAARRLAAEPRTYGLDELRTGLAPLPRHARHFAAAMRVLERHGYVALDGATLRTTDKAAGAAADEARLGAEIARDYPAAAGPRRLLDACLARWIDVLAGEVPATDVLFPGGSMERVLDFYRGNPLADRSNALTAATLHGWAETSLRRRAPGERLRLLELGAGTGATTEMVLKALAPFEERIDYVYTDVSAAFLNYGRRRFGAEHPGVSYARLDLEAAPEDSDALGEFDAVFATNVVHATRDIGESLDHIAAKLRPGGLLLLNELTRGQDLLTLTFGLLDDWWRFEDERLPDGPLLNAALWRKELAARFDAVEIVAPGNNSEAPQSLILARRAATITAVTAPAKPAAAPISAEPRASIAALPAQAPAEPSLAELETALAAIHRAVAEALEIDAETIPDDAAFNEIGVDSIVSADVIYRLENALGRRLGPSVLNDHPTPRRLARHLADSSENAPATSSAPPPAAAEAPAPEQALCRRLTLARPGNLDGLGIEAVPHRGPGPGEVEIAVAAAGLNFRDVLRALGKLDAGENAALGLEFAGTVTAIGPGVAGLMPGEAVFGVSPNAFADRLTVPAELVAPLPPGLDAVTAASLPIVFLTAVRTLEDIAGLQAGQTVLIHAGAGGVGLAAIQVARRAGARIFATAGSPEKRQYLKDLGVERVMNSRNLDFADDILAATAGEGVDIVLGAVAGAFVDRGLAALGQSGGWYLEIGKADRRDPAVVAAAHPGVHYRVYDLLGEILEQPAVVGAALRRLTAHFAAGDFAPLPVRRFGLDKASDAFRWMSRAQHIGKIVLTIGEGEPAAAPAETAPPAPPSSAEPRRARAEWAAPGRAARIAIVGISGRFPGAADLDALWTLISEGQAAAGDAPAGRWTADELAIFAGEHADDVLLRRGGFIADAESFDAGFFHLSPREALQMDPQQRVLLEEAWNALADAGHPEGRTEDLRCGVFIGASAGDYAQKLVLARQPADGLSLINALPSSLASRISYAFDLKGPALVVDMGCVSGLAALQMACESLRRGESEVALAGAVNLFSTPQLPAQARAAGILSARGSSAAFAADADGMLLGEAAVVLVLKPLDAALAAGDAIHGLIREVGVNHDGATNGFATPASRHQTRLQQDVLAAAGIAPDTISYIEGHGVGSPVGDTTELWALKSAFAEAGPGAIAIGSVKSNFGHTLGAAGLVGLCKILLQFRHDTIAPSLHVAEVGTRDLLAGSPFAVATAPRPWPRGNGAPRLAAINGFAINGANSFALVEEPPAAAAAPDTPARGPLPVLLAAHSETALRRRCADLATWLDRREVGLADLARSLAAPGRRLGWRAAFLAADCAELGRQLEAAAGGKPGRRWRIGTAGTASTETGAVLGEIGTRLVAEAMAETDANTARAKLLAAGELFVAGHDFPIAEALPPGRRLSLLPPYPFERTRFWPEPAAAAELKAPPPTGGADPVAILRQIVGALLHMEAPELPLDRPLVELGVESILALELCRRVEAAFGCRLEVAHALGSRGVAELAAQIAAGRPETIPEPAFTPEPAAAYDPFPLNDLQLAYWLGRGRSFALGGAGCQIYWEFERAEEWDVARLETAWRRLIECHDMLCATVDRNGEQRVLAEVSPYPIEAHDWRGLSPAVAAERLEPLRAALGDTPFDAERWPLFRLAVSREDGVMRLHFAIDLLIADVLSIFRLLDQFGRAYRDGPDTIAAPALRFRDCLLHLRRLEEGPAYRRALDYWRGEIADLPPAPALPQSRDPASLKRPRVRRHEARLAPDEWQLLRDTARRRGVTPVNAMLAAFAEVLGRWAAAPRFTLNLTAYQRPGFDPAVREVVGDFTATVLLGIDLGTAMPFAERAAALGRKLAAHLDHAQVGGVRVLRMMAEERPGERALMPVVFTSTLGYAPLRDAHGGADELGRLAYGITRTPQVWLDCQLYEDQDGLLLAWDAVDELFPDGLIAAMFTAYADLVRRLATDPETWQAALGEVLLGEEQARRAAANATDAPIDPGLLHQPFLRQARVAPDRIAVVAPDRILSYGELLAGASGVAARLAGIAPNRLVAIAMPKGWQQVVAALGVVMAGAAYLPIDPGLPAQRRHALLRRGEATVVLTCAGSPADWPEGIEAISVESIAPTTEPPDAAPRCSNTDLAYVIFTSGSTGEPKGVMIDHRGALNTVLDVTARFAVGPDDRVLGLSALSFDLSVYDIFGILGAGAAIVLPRPESLADPAYLAGLIAEHRVTIWNSVPSYLQLLLQDPPEPAALASLRLAMLSGDWIPLSLPPALRAVAPAARLVSLGGATEASIWSICHPVEALDPAWPSIPYGRPMQSQRFYVLDESLAESRDWVPGELYIGGIGLAQGYWRDPERTAASFIRHPETGERLYRTGDIGRWREDGLIEFLGRRDTQVKINGFRVELGEIEAAARRFAGLRDAVAVTCRGDSGGKRLVLFCVAEHAGGLNPAAIRAGLAAQLPGYMVPSRIEAIEALPLNANKKVDRNALTARAAAPDVPTAAAAAPLANAEGRSVEAIEAELVALWRGLLRRADLDPTINLAELGADSLTAVEANRRIRVDLGLPCTVTDIFEHPTIRALARHLHAAQDGAAAPIPADREPEPEPEAADVIDLRARRSEQRRRFRAEWR